MADRDFPGASGYLNTASIGLPPAPAAEAMHAAIDDWAAGRATAPGYDVLRRTRPRVVRAHAPRRRRAGGDRAAGVVLRRAGRARADLLPPVQRRGRRRRRAARAQRRRFVVLTMSR